jgi:hypothetical protein
MSQRQRIYTGKLFMNGEYMRNEEELVEACFKDRKKT